MDSLNWVQYWLCRGNRVKSLDMKNNAFAGARIDEKTGESKSLAQCKRGCLFSQRSKSNRFYRQLDFPGNTRFKNFRLVLENDIDSGNSGGRVTKRA